MRVYPPGGVPTTISHGDNSNVAVSVDGVDLPDDVAERLVDMHGFTAETPKDAPCATT